MIYFFTIIQSLLVLSYFFVWIIFFVKWKNKYKKGLNIFPLPASCIVCVYNEEHNLPLFLNDIKHFLSLDPNNEVIFYLDGSTDRSEEIIHNFKNEYASEKITIISNPVNLGKKTAINNSVKLAKNNWIFLRDADTFTKDSPTYSAKNIPDNYLGSLIAGSVLVKNENNFLSNFQFLESCVMNVFSTGSIELKIPAMISASVLWFNKNDFLDVKPYDHNLHIRSGDDMFLLDAFLKNKKKIISNPKQIVYTYPKKKWMEFIKQRMRWGGKSIFLNNPYNKGLALFLMMINLSVLISIFIEKLTMLGLYFYGIKCLIDILFLFLTLQTIKEKASMSHILGSVIIYPLYFVLTSLISPFHYVFQKK
jgi:glycosyltransferase involved in cell wall biosynthesis